jgi:hypothetical protein
MAGDPERPWVKAIGEKLRDDLGDCPTLPDEMVELLQKLRESERKTQAGAAPGKKGTLPKPPK